ncbi:hypothetical protein FDP22_02370 [Paroceanicella profunda]|uniref:Dienelactone hydrolase n=1 Tax=Paroceanicella profunda TaxID=2579971 RepID=A0A5B8FXB3_9RHOB|nr:hypothetical protein [Paroceanicella profunda]QDL90733.1 hypothetical protein FDP22_02370 [Paroceanicella profunda]
MMRLVPALLSLLAALATAGAEAGEAPVGVRALGLAAPDRGTTTLDSSIWYPAGPGGERGAYGGSPVFRATPARLGAPLAPGRFPLILLSHGGLRSAPHMGDWLAAGLAARGMMVAVIRPPAPPDARTALAEYWRRPADFSAALDGLLADPDLAPHFDPERVGAVGLFLGGTSVLALAGVRVDPDALRTACDVPGQLIDCAWFDAQGVDLHRADLAPLSDIAPDPRFRVGVVVDPELTKLLAADSLRDVTIPVTAVNLGTSDLVAPELDASGLIARIPGFSYAALPGASRFDAFALCTPRGSAILAEEGAPNSPLCAARSRAAAHRQLLARVYDGLRRGMDETPEPGNGE